MLYVLRLDNQYFCLSSTFLTLSYRKILRPSLDLIRRIKDCAFLALGLLERKIKFFYDIVFGFVAVGFVKKKALETQNSY